MMVGIVMMSVHAQNNRATTAAKATTAARVETEMIVIVTKRTEVGVMDAAPAPRHLVYLGHNQRPLSTEHHSLDGN